MPARPATRIAVLAGAALCLTAPAQAGAQASAGAGGTAAPVSPAVTAAVCSDGRTSECGSGRELALRGANLHGATKVVFRGGRGSDDDRAAEPAQAAAGAVTVAVPATARTGRVTVITPGGRATSESVALDPPGTTLKLAAADYAFPIAGRHEIGPNFNQSFGGGRGHQGHDVFARCGTPVVANVAGTVKQSEYHGAAGNYVVVDGLDGRSYAFMHLRRPSSLKVGEPVYAGEPVGRVGDTGRASGCHLHFEIWTAPGYHAGGEPIDPLPELRAWQRAATAARARARAAKARTAKTRAAQARAAKVRAARARG